MAGIGETFPNGERGEHDGYAFQYDRPIQARIASYDIQRYVNKRVQAKYPGCNVGEIFQAGDLIVCDGH